MSFISDQTDLAHGLSELIKIEPGFSLIADLVGPLPKRSLPQGFEGLANIIVSQLISRAAADAIWLRMMAAGLPMTATGYLEVNEELAKSFGLSMAKHRALLNLAEQMSIGAINFDELSQLDSATAHRRLVSLKGIGPWTAEVYLLFAVGHCDVFPAGDVALQAAAAKAFSLPARPSEKELSKFSENWRPWRSIAARALWAYYGAVMKRNVTPLP